MSTPINTAAWITAKQAKIEVGVAPYTSPRDNEIVVKNHAVAINPVDWIKQQLGDFLFSWIKYPFVLGQDLAGEVVEVGTAVSRFKVGDRVLAHAVGLDKERNNAAEGAFQIYSVVLAHMAAPIPDFMPFESAAVLPLGLSTAACGLFQKDHLALQYPSNHPEPNGQTLLIWGGSTSVGSNAIQLAVAAGYEVITTASPKNFDYVRKLGASQVFDYNDKGVVQDVIQAFKGKTSAGALAIGKGSFQACLEIVPLCAGRKFVSMATFPVSFDKLPDQSSRISVVTGIMPQMIGFGLSLLVSRRRKIQTKFIDGSSLMNNEVSQIIYQDFLPEALAGGHYIAAPDAYTIGKGLDSIQTGFDLQKKGVSAKKVVVSL